MAFSKHERLHPVGITTALFCAICLLSSAPACANNYLPEPANIAKALVEQNIRPLVLVDGMKDQQSLSDRMAYYSVPGMSIAVIHNGKIDWAKGYGILQTGKNAPVTADTYFEAASISKPVTALTTMVQVQKGTIDLNAPIDQSLKRWHLPSSTFSSSSPPTARQIMCHHAGFNVEFVSGYSIGEAVPTLIEVLNGTWPSITPAVQVIQTPGKNFEYSAGGFLVLQQALIDIGSNSFDSFESLVERTVFIPLDMLHSTFEQPSLTQPTPLLARGHNFAGNPAVRRTYPELSAAGLRTTASDLCRVILEIQDAAHGHGKILSKESAQQMLTAQDEKPSIGLGFFLAGKDDARRFSMDGWNYGFTCRMVGFVDKGEGAVVMTNSDNGALMFEVLDAIGKVYAWPVQPSSCKIAQPILPKTVQSVVGRYKWSDTEQAEVIAQGSRIFLHVFHVDKKIMDPFPPAELFAKSEREYFSIFPQMTVHLETDKNNQIAALIYDLEGKDVRAERLP